MFRTSLELGAWMLALEPGFRNQSYRPSPAYGLAACVFSPAGLFTTSKCSSSKMTHGTTGLPEIPRTLPNYPKAEQEICNRMCGHRIAQPVLADDQPLVSEAAENARQPTLGMNQAENGRGHDERQGMKLAKG